ncbi:MAG: ribbon-helix-helix protein, CopG family [Anaerolineae bacterium]|nr:ribbon-helix-helix protein, CopG family [Anaerolineae bacterium]
MTNRTITLRADLVERLEKLAERQGRSLDEVFGEILGHYLPAPGGNNWALAVAEHMEQADIAWSDDPDASLNSRQHYERHLHEKWQRIQNADDDNG